MHEHELWFTAFLNRYFAGPADAVLRLGSSIGLPGLHPGDPYPWTNYMAMEILVILILAVAALALRRQLSVDKPGTFQLTVEAVYEFLAQQARDIIGHDYTRYMAFFFTIAIFILASNLLGMVPTFEAPTMYYYVPAGIAICSFLYYNGQGVRTHGVFGYLKEFCGPMWWLAWFMFPLELISHCIRPLSLTIRLYANMFAGEAVTGGFLSMAAWIVPIAVMALHLLVVFIQAFIFTVLTIAYVGMAVAHEEGH